MNIQNILKKLLAKQELTKKEMQQTMRKVMLGALSSAQIAAFLVALCMKGETVGEITAAATVMLEFATKISIAENALVDIVGTGGDNANLFNISTLTAFIVAAAGGIVAKHGNRSVSSKSGSADVLEAAGCNVQLTAEQVTQCIENIGIGFLFAPQHHPAMRYVAPVRKELGIRTIFNLLGALTNPASAKRQLVGVYDSEWLIPFAKTLQALGSKHCIVVHSEDGLDEISIAANTNVVELKNDEIKKYSIKPEDFSLSRQALTSLIVANADESLSLFQRVLNNEPGPWLDIIILNAGAAIYVAGLMDSIDLGIQKAKSVIAAGLALKKFADFIAFTRRFPMVEVKGKG